MSLQFLTLADYEILNNLLENQQKQNLKLTDFSLVDFSFPLMYISHSGKRLIVRKKPNCPN